jgi:thioredoxin-like negative regulator of GroEL
MDYTMGSLDTHHELEVLLGRLPRSEEEGAAAAAAPLPAVTAIYFTARWCTACKKLDIPAIQAAFPNVHWLKCDVDVNTYSPGFCGVRSIPSFMLINNQRPTAAFTSSSTEKVVAWIQGHLVN